MLLMLYTLCCHYQEKPIVSRKSTVILKTKGIRKKLKMNDRPIEIYYTI